MSNPVLFYFDFSSPYGYFAAQKIDETVADFGRRVTWKPIMLGAAMKETGNVLLVVGRCIVAVHEVEMASLGNIPKHGMFLLKLHAVPAHVGHLQSGWE